MVATVEAPSATVSNTAIMHSVVHTIEVVQMLDIKLQFGVKAYHIYAFWEIYVKRVAFLVELHGFCTAPSGKNPVKRHFWIEFEFCKCSFKVKRKLYQPSAY